MNTDETWRPLPGFEDTYQVSDQGRIKSLPYPGRTGRKRGRILTPALCRKGYQHFRACGLDGKGKRLKVHTAVAAAFLGPRPEGMQVNHKNGIKTDNRPDNLEYVTCRQNIRHGWQNGLYSAEHCRGERNNKSRLTLWDVAMIRGLQSALSLTELAELCNVTRQAIWAVVQRKTWKHVA